MGANAIVEVFVLDRCRVIVWDRGCGLCGGTGQSPVLFSEGGSVLTEVKAWSYVFLVQCLLNDHSIARNGQTGIKSRQRR
jgi:hypothetical protein